MFETERLRMRPLTRVDVDALAKLHADPRVNRFVPAITREQALQRLLQIEEQWSDHRAVPRPVRGDTAFDGRVHGRCGLDY